MRAFFFNQTKMKGRFSYAVEVPLLNFNAQGVNKFSDVASNSLLDPANKPGLVVAITGIETYFNGLYSMSPSQRPVVTQADATKLAVTLRVGNDEPIFQTPYLSYCTILNYGVVKEIVPTPINLSKSEIVVQDALASNAFSVIINFWYQYFTTAEWNLVVDRIKMIQKAQPIKHK